MEIGSKNSVGDGLRVRRLGATGFDIVLFCAAVLGWGGLWDTVRWLAGLVPVTVTSVADRLALLVGPGLAALAMLAYFGILAVFGGCTLGGELFGLRLEATAGKLRAILRVLVFPGPLVVTALLGASLYAFAWPDSAVVIAAAIGAAVVLALDLFVAGLVGSGGESLHDYAGATRVVHTPGMNGHLLLRRSGALAVDWCLLFVGIAVAGAFDGPLAGFFTRGTCLFKWPGAWLVSAGLVLVYFSLLPACGITTLGMLLFRLRPSPVRFNVGAILRAVLTTIVYPGPVCALMVLGWLVPRGQVADSLGPSGIMHWIRLLGVAYLGCGIVLALDFLTAFLANGRFLHDVVGGTTVGELVSDKTVRAGKLVLAAKVAPCHD